MELSPLGPAGVNPAAVQVRASSARETQADETEFAVPGPTEAADWPPPEVWREVDNAGRAWEALRAQGRELHFEPNTETGRVVITVRDLDGNVLRTVPAEDAIAIASGVSV
jgi:hypothetical protein